MASKPPVQEWVVTDQESFVKAVDGVRKFRQLSLQDLYSKLGNRGPTDLIRGYKNNLNCSNLIHAITSLEMELLLRPTEDRATQWVFTSDEGFKDALDGMRRLRGYSPQGLHNLLGSRSITMIIRGVKTNMRSSSLIQALGALNFELVFRRITTSSKVQRRLDLLRAAKEGSERGKGKDAPDLEITQSDLRRDERGRLKPQAVLTEQEKAEAEALLERYSSFG